MDCEAQLAEQQYKHL